MKIAIISDLHLGDGGRTDHFGHSHADFLTFLDRLEAEFEEIVLLGDVYETLSGRFLGRPVRQLAAVRATHAPLVERFARPVYTYLHGNHDICLGWAEGAPESIWRERDGMRIYLTHGHHHDRVIRHARWFSETGVWAGGWMTRGGLGWLRYGLSRIEDRMRTSPDPDSCRFQRWARDVARRRGADVIVTGHTHERAVHDHGDVVFANSGACCHGELGFVAIDTARGEVSVHRER